MSLINKIILISALILLAGCQPAVVKKKAYRGEELPLDELSFLKCAQYIDIKSIDNTPIKTKSGGGLDFSDCEIALKPGAHTVTLCFHEDRFCYEDIDTINKYNKNYSSNYGPVTLMFYSYPGHIYSINAQIISNRTRYYEASSKSANLSIIDTTERDRIKIYYNRAKETADKAKEYQNDNKWGLAFEKWNKSLAYAEKGDIGIDIIASINLSIGHSLGVLCNYDEALIHLEKSNQYYQDNDQDRYKTIIPKARIYALKGMPNESNAYYKTILFSKELLLQGNDEDLHEELMNEYNILNKSGFNKQQAVDLYRKYEYPYGSQCLK